MKESIPLTKYQVRWVNDKSRFKIGCWSRQCGKSFSTSLEAVVDCWENAGATWVFLSAGERQSKELIRKAKMHATSIDMAIESIETDYFAGDTIYKMLEINFPNGSRIIGLPANPDTAVGWSANILLDEFSKHKDSYEIWKAMYPTVTRGYKVRVISTFKGKQNKFYDLFYATKTLQIFEGMKSTYVGDKGGWSKHLVNIEQAVEMGLALKDDKGKACDLEDLRIALADDDIWKEDFMCEASEESTSFITHDMITACENHTLTATPSWVPELINSAQDAYAKDKINVRIFGLPDIGKNLYLGFDVARSRDFSVIWIDQKRGEILSTVAIIAMKNFPFTVQETILLSIIPHVERACIDRGLIGMNLTEKAIDKYGGHRVEGVDFNQKYKERMAFDLRQNLEDRKSEMPIDKDIRASFRSVKKYNTTTNYARFDAERTDKTGHADHFWAKALAVLAASGPVSGPVGYEGAGNIKKFFGRIGVI